MAAKKSPFFDTATTLGKIVAFFGVSALSGVLAAGLMVPIASLAGSSANAGTEIFDALPASFKGEPIAQPSKILAKDGSTIATFYSENRQPVKLKNISKVMQSAIISIEDERFYEHNGIDVRGIARAAVNNFTSSSQQGASTLTQQYVNNLLVNADVVNGVDRSEMTISGSKDIADKAREAKLAISIEKEMTKDEILEGYLNLVLFSGRNYGIQAAAQRFYSVDAKDLNLQQSAMLAGMVQLPNAYNPEKYPERSLKRRNTVLAAMLRTGAIDKNEYDKAVKSKLGVKPKEVKSGCIAAEDSAYFCDYVTRLITTDEAYGKTRKDRENLLYRGGLTIKTTLDPRLQKEAAKQSRAMIPADDKSNIGAAIVTVEPGTGNILAMGQNKDYVPTDKNTGPNTTINFAVEKALGGAGGFQGGSTMKPYTTMAWLESGRNMWDRISAPNKKNYPASFRWKASCLPRGYTTVGGGWAPANAVGGYPSSMTVDYGLFNSVNSATVAEASKLDLCDIAEGTERLGLIDYDNNIDPATGKKSTLGQPISPANPAFVIGSARITPLAQATAFATFANNGEFCDNRALTSVTDAKGTAYKVKPVTCEQAVSPQVVADMNGTMTKIAKQKVTKGAIDYPISGKTGTNNKANSTWFVGYTTGMASAAWVGRYDKQQNLETKNKVIDGIARRWVDSGTWASPLWTNYMKKVGDLYPTESFGKAKSAPKPPAPKKVEADDDDTADSASSETSASKETKEPKESEAPKATETPKPKGNSGNTPNPPKKTEDD
ncbi:transglycosylase domain-containing protein [Paeniglutamicibacter sulfureus]|uniref:transglycosylase domain-containing protein n=1 Tax=Paeniglutamicibacter sulfureus TaxID=43666 RepID=UPI002666675C|nr:transglycosylase domain-containing protein [Paeniglutamicibacter sulfureus]MDO2935294.1 transglycosylase domain-containing protein [Paeniglutamicibacter sulfureus]